MSKCYPRTYVVTAEDLQQAIGEGEIDAADWGRGDDPHGMGQAVQREG